MDCCAPTGRLPLSVADLSTGEQLLLWAIRTRLEGRDRLGKVQEAFALAAHPHPGSVFACFEPWFLVLSSHARRDLLLHRAPCPCVSADELAMVQLVATQQAGAPARSAELARDLVEPGMVDALLETAGTLAAALGRLGLVLPQRRTLLRPSPASAQLH